MTEKKDSDEEKGMNYYKLLFGPMLFLLWELGLRTANNPNVACVPCAELVMGIACFIVPLATYAVYAMKEEEKGE